MAGTIDNRGEEGLETLYSTMGACLTPSRDSIKSSRESHNFVTPQRLYFLPERESLCTVAESHEVLKSKEARIRRLS